METLPTEEEVLEYFSTLSNWGRWGNDDQMGTLNYLDKYRKIATTNRGLY